MVAGTRKIWLCLRASEERELQHMQSEINRLPEGITVPL